MTASRVYKLSLALPYLLPVLACLALRPIPLLLDGPPAVGVKLLVVVLFWSSLLEAVPYAVLVIGLMVLTRGRPPLTVRRALLRSPIWLVGLTWIFCVVLVLVQSGPGPRRNLIEVLQGLGASALFALAFGYVYVAISLALVRLLECAGIVDER